MIAGHLDTTAILGLIEGGVPAGLPVVITSLAAP